MSKGARWFLLCAAWGLSIGITAGADDDPLADLAKQLKDKDPKLRSAAVRVLAKSNQLALPLLREAALKDADLNVRRDAIAAVGEIALEETSGGLAILTAVFQGGKTQERDTAAQALGRLGPQGFATIQTLLKNSDVDVRRAALEAVIFAGPDGKELVKDVAAALQDKSPLVRGLAAEVLGRFGKDAKPAILPLAKMASHDTDNGVRGKAALTMRFIEPTESNTKAVATLLTQTDEKARKAATDTVVRYDRGAAPLLLRMLKSKDEQVQAAAIVILARLSCAGAAGVPDLLASFKDHKNDRKLFLTILTRLESEDAEAVPKLVAGLQNEDPDVRGLVIEVLMALALRSRPAAGSLVLLLNDKDEDLKKRAQDALEKRDAKKKAVAVPVLVTALRHPDEQVRLGAAGVLLRLGPAAADATAALTRALEEEDSTDVRVQATLALQKLGGK